MENRAQAAAAVAKVFQFEQWLRFYFVTQQGEALHIEVPADRLEEIRAAEPQLFDLANMVNNTETNYKKSCDSVCVYVSTHLDGQRYSSSLLNSLLNGRDFQVEMQLFNLWIQGHEGYLDEEYRPFAEWQRLYEGWKGTTEVQNLRSKMLQSQPAGGQEPSATVH